MSTQTQIEIIDLCDSKPTYKDEVLEWNVEVQKILVSYEMLDNCNLIEFEKLLYDYFQCLKSIDYFKHTATLDERMTYHIEFIYSCMKELRFDIKSQEFISEITTYLENILTKFMEVKINLYDERAGILDTKIKESLNPEELTNRKRNILKNFVQRSLYYLQLFFGDKESSMLHVFIHIDHKKYTPNGKEYLSMMIQMYLSKWPPTDFSNDGFARGYLVFHKLKELYSQNKHKKIDENLYSLYKRTADDTPDLFKPIFDNKLDISLFISNPTTVLAKLYFDYINREKDNSENKTSNNTFTNTLSQSSDQEYTKMFNENSKKTNDENFQINIVPKSEIINDSINEVSNQMKEANITTADGDDDIILISDFQENNLKEVGQLKDAKCSENAIKENLDQIINISKIDLNSKELPPRPKPPDSHVKKSVPFSTQQSVSSSSNDANMKNNSSSLSKEYSENSTKSTRCMISNNCNGDNNMNDTSSKKYGEISTTDTPMLSSSNSNESGIGSEVFAPTTLGTGNKNEIVITSHNHICPTEIVCKETDLIGQISPDSRNTLVDKSNDKVDLFLNCKPIKHSSSLNIQSQIIITDVNNWQMIGTSGVKSNSRNLANETICEGSFEKRKLNHYDNILQNKIHSDTLQTVSTTSEFMDHPFEISTEVTVLAEEGSSFQVQDQSIETTTHSENEYDNDMDIEEHPLPSINETFEEVTGSEIVNEVVNESNADKEYKARIVFTLANSDFNLYNKHNQRISEEFASLDDGMSGELRPRNIFSQREDIVSNADDNDTDIEHSSRVSSPDVNSPAYEVVNGKGLRKYFDKEVSPGDCSSITTPIDVNRSNTNSPQTSSFASDYSVSPSSTNLRLEKFINEDFEILVNMDSLEAYGVQSEDKKLRKRTLKVVNNKFTNTLIKMFSEISRHTRGEDEKDYKSKLSYQSVEKVLKDIPFTILIEDRELNYNSFNQFLEIFRKSVSRSKAKLFEHYFLNCLCNIEYSNKSIFPDNSKYSSKKCLFKFKLKYNLANEAEERIRIQDEDKLRLKKKNVQDLHLSSKKVSTIEDKDKINKEIVEKCLSNESNNFKVKSKDNVNDNEVSTTSVQYEHKAISQNTNGYEQEDEFSPHFNASDNKDQINNNKQPKKNLTNKSKNCKKNLNLKENINDNLYDSKNIVPNKTKSEKVTQKLINNKNKQINKRATSKKNVKNNKKNLVLKSVYMNHKSKALPKSSEFSGGKDNDESFMDVKNAHEKLSLKDHIDSSRSIDKFKQQDNQDNIDLYFKNSKCYDIKHNTIDKTKKVQEKPSKQARNSQNLTIEKSIGIQSSEVNNFLCSTIDNYSISKNNNTSNSNLDSKILEPASSSLQNQNTDCSILRLPLKKRRRSPKYENKIGNLGEESQQNLGLSGEIHESEIINKTQKKIKIGDISEVVNEISTMPQKELSYPAKPALSLAVLMALQESQARVKTPGERKQMAENIPHGFKQNLNYYKPICESNNCHPPQLTSPWHFPELNSSSYLPPYPPR